jgi:chemotaxis protein MotB
MPPGAKDQKKIIIKKKIAGHGGGHHGGSWKVAYADFVTAMMAFFMVMWIVGMDDQAKDSIEGYFANPVGFKKGYGSGSSPMGSGNTPVLGRRETPMPARMAEETAMASAAQRLQQAFRDSTLSGFSENVSVSLSPEGLRVEFGEGLVGDATFASGSAVMTGPMLRALAFLGAEIAPLPNNVIIEGHTDGVPLMRPGGYSNWELSADRANAARRALQTQGVDDGRVVSVRGFADRAPKIADFPNDPRNRRISILLPFRTPASTVAGVDAAAVAVGPAP